jgi:chemotaxis protein histidine kinase CheA
MAGISITLAGNFAKLDELKGKADKAAKSIKDSFKKVANSAAFKGLAVGATTAFAAISAAAAKSIKKGGELTDTMARTGAAGGKLLVLERAFVNAGIAGEKVPTVLNKMQQALAGTNDEGQLTSTAFRKLGLSIEELQKLDPVDAFRKTSQAIAQIPDPAGRAAAAMELFGRAGGELLVVMNDPNAFGTARDQVGSLADTLPGVAGEFDSIADAMADFGTKAEQLGTQVAITLLPVLNTMVELINSIDLGSFDWKNPFSSQLTAADRQRAKQKAADWAEDDPMHGKSVKEVEAAKLEASNADFWARKEKEKQDAIEARAQKEREAAEKQAEADRKKAEATEESRAAAAEEYRLENAILAARLKGDADRLAKLEREKAIREEMKKLESAGFTAAEARKPAEAKVDAETAASAAENARRRQRETQEDLAAKLGESRSNLENLQYQSSVGSISSMQRIGGGGGAVASGLDYQRQVADLQREANGYLRQLIEVSRQPPE